LNADNLRFKGIPSVNGATRDIDNIKSLLTSLFQRDPECFRDSLEKRGEGRFLQFDNHPSLEGYIQRFIKLVRTVYAKMNLSKKS